MSGGGGLYEMLREGGIFALLVVGFGVLGTLMCFASALGAFMVKKRAMAFGFAGFCFFVVFGLLALGGIGMLLGNGKVEEAVAFASVKDQAMLLERGYAEAKIPFQFALAFSVLPFLAGLACTGIAAMKKSQ